MKPTPLRDRLRKDVLEFLYEKGKDETSILALARALNVRSETVKKIVDEFAETGHVSIKKTKDFPFKMIITLTETGEKLASELFSTDEGKLGLAEKLLLIILYAVGGQVRGTTKLEKLPFLLEHDFGVQLSNIFNYFPHFYGPYSRDVIKTVNVLNYYGLVNVSERVYTSEIEEDRERVMRIYTLTSKGEELAKNLFRRLPDELIRRIVKLRVHAQKTTKQLLKYVYTKYPEFKKYTTLDELS